MHDYATCNLKRNIFINTNTYSLLKPHVIYSSTIIIYAVGGKINATTNLNKRYCAFLADDLVSLYATLKQFYVNLT